MGSRKQEHEAKTGYAPEQSLSSYGTVQYPIAMCGQIVHRRFGPEWEPAGTAEQTRRRLHACDRWDGAKTA